MDSSCVRAKEIVSIREHFLLSRTNKTSRPASRSCTAPMLRPSWRRLDSKPNPVFDAGRLRRNQPASPFQFISGQFAVSFWGWRIVLVAARLSTFLFCSRFPKLHRSSDLLLECRCDGSELSVTVAAGPLPGMANRSDLFRRMIRLALEVQNRWSRQPRLYSQSERSRLAAVSPSPRSFAISFAPGAPPSRVAFRASSFPFGASEM
jgi:hypothetical protein